jgi:hypothetical protein
MGKRAGATVAAASGAGGEAGRGLLAGLAACVVALVPQPEEMLVRMNPSIRACMHVPSIVM